MAVPPGEPAESLALRVGPRMDRLVGRRGPVVAAVSGGSDSVALLRLLHDRLPDRVLVVAHLNHGTRGEEATADERFVEALAHRLGRPFERGQWRPERSAHFEVDARRARYAWLIDVARRHQAHVVVAGHTRDDQAETILHRILRGTGPSGLKGMPSRRRLNDQIWLARPLLDCSRDELRKYLESVGQDWREDQSNSDPAFTRARIRHALMPLLQTGYNPRVTEALARLGRLVSSERKALDRALARLESMVSAQAAAPVGGMAFDREKLGALSGPELSALLRSVWRRHQWPEREMTAERWEHLARFARRGRGRLDLPGGVAAVHSPAGTLSLAPAPDPIAQPPPIPQSLPIPGKIRWSGGFLESWVEGPGQPTPQPGAERMDLARIRPPLWVGPPASGDRFDPLGLDGRTQPLADFLRSRKVPRNERVAVPIVRDALGIVWVAGHRIAQRVRLTPATQRVLAVRWVTEPTDSGPDAPPSEEAAS